MIERLFHGWERRLASVSTTDRVVRPFEWGLEWLPRNGHGPAAGAEERFAHYVDEVMRDTDAFFTPPPTADYLFTPAPAGLRRGGEAGTLTFPSALTTPHPENNTVHGRYFPATPKPGAPRRGVVVLPQWNSDEEGHVGLAKLLSQIGLSAIRLSLPYHDRRMPAELSRADYIVSSNLGRTLQVCRQAVLDARRAVHWLHAQGYDRIGILGTSLGSCLAMLTASHEPLIKVQALNHVSPFFADVVWRGLSTSHVRQGLDGEIELERLRHLWRPISPWSYLDRHHDRRTLLVYARYDLTFPLDLSRVLIDEFRRRGLPHDVAMLPCGHYSTGATPFKYLDAWHLGRFLTKHL
jgi:dienelactone hydrolase